MLSRHGYAALLLAGVAGVYPAAGARGQDGASAPSAPLATAKTAPSSPASAPPPTAASPGIEQVVVTATRRKQLLRKVPESVQVVSGAQIKKLQIFDFREVQELTPGLELNNDTGRLNTATLRGVAFDPDSGAAPAVDTYFNEIPIDANTAFLSIYDVGQFEVLNGSARVVPRQNVACRLDHGHDPARGREQIHRLCARDSRDSGCHQLPGRGQLSDHPRQARSAHRCRGQPERRQQRPRHHQQHAVSVEYREYARLCSLRRNAGPVL